jgi:hypothetical protein
MTILRGTILKGWGTAHKAIALQKKYLSEFYQDLFKFHLGTINVQLDDPLIITQFDMSTPPIKWHPNVDTDRFSFLRVGLQLDLPGFGAPVDAVIYHAAASPHPAAASPDQRDPRFIEIMTHKLHIVHDSRCSIHVNRPSERLPSIVLY